MGDESPIDVYSAPLFAKRATPKSEKKEKQICISLRYADSLEVLTNAATLDRK